MLSIQHGRFFLEGRPFAEISFNKFDRFWQLAGDRYADPAKRQMLYAALDKTVELCDRNDILRGSAE